MRSSASARRPIPTTSAISTFEELVFPALPGGVRNCFEVPRGDQRLLEEAAAPRSPDATGHARGSLAAVCGACHDSTDAQAHIQVQTTGAGAESCGVCHDADAEWSVERVHRAY
jgi:cytochrome c553